MPSGILTWFGSTRFPDGTTAIPAINLNEWRQNYTRLESGALRAGVIPPLQSLNAAAINWRADGPLHLSLVNVIHAATSERFQARVSKAVGAGTSLAPAPGSLSDVIETKRVFMACGMLRDQFAHDLPTVRGRTVRYVIDTTLFASNDSTALTELSVDLGDGSGFRAVTFDQEVQASYQADGTVTVTIRCTCGSERLEAQMKVAIESTVPAPPPSETWTLGGTPSGAKGVAYVYPAAGHSEIVNPIVVAEGFPGGYPADYIYDSLSGNGLLATLQQRGYDLVVVSYNGTLPIEQNAEVFEVGIAQALTRVSGKHATPAPLIVGGMSMGGVVSRYALTSMESRGVDHGARVFFTVDSPHGGAYTNVSSQWLLHFLAPTSTLARDLSALLDCPANQQFIALWTTGGDTIVSPMRTAFLEKLASIGNFPKKPLCIAVANGRGDGKRSLPAGAPILRWSGSPYASAECFALHEGSEAVNVASGYCLRADPAMPATLMAASPVSWEGAPGGINFYNAMAAEVAIGLGLGTVEDMAPALTAISTLSALAIDAEKYDAFAPVPPPGSGASPFSDYLCGIENTRHITITAESSAWLAAHFGEPTAMKA